VYVVGALVGKSGWNDGVVRQYTVSQVDWACNSNRRYGAAGTRSHGGRIVEIATEESLCTRLDSCRDSILALGYYCNPICKQIKLLELQVRRAHQRTG